MKKTSLIICTSLAIFSAIATVSTTIAWFSHIATIDNSNNVFNGEVEDSYYAYGNGNQPTDGQDPRPFGISKPRHLYNLAWLQFLGFYNNTEGKQYYFELANDIDMTDWYLPPIGTEDKPFVGNFNGKGYTISNLNVTNDFSQIKKHPSVINETIFNDDYPHILGLFGVVGNLDLESTTWQYDNSIIELKDLGIKDINVNSKVPNSLMGLAAGYANGTMSNVAVESGTINLDKESISSATTSYGGFTENISDFTLVGYTPKKTQIKKVTNKIYNVDIEAEQQFVANTQGSTLGWGGSIDMNSIYSRLTSLKPNNDTTDDFAVNYKQYDDEILNTEVVQTQTVRRYIGNNYQGHINYIGNPGSNKHYLVGGEYVTRTVYASKKQDSYSITDGTHYLTLNGANLTNSSSTQTYWNFSKVSGPSKISAVNNTGTTYYLRNNNGTLTTTTDANAATSFDILFENNQLQISSTYNNQTLVLLYKDNAWTLSRNLQITGTNGGRYLPTNVINNNNSSLASVTTSQIDYFVDFVNGNQVSFYENGTRYYLYAFYDNGNSYVIAKTSTNSGTNQHKLNSYINNGNLYIRTNDTVRVNNNDNYMFLNLNNNNWVISLNRNTTAVAMRYSDNNWISNTLTETPTTSSKMEFTAENTTYFPIMVDDSYNADDANIGYFVAGTTNSTWANGSSSHRSIIVSSYSKSEKLTKGYSNNAFVDSGVYTVNENGAGPIDLVNQADRYIKYGSSKSTLQEKLKNANNIGGFHFYATNADIGSISENSIVNAENVVVNGEAKDVYQLPVYSLDFNLKEKGRINFFAGMYNGGNGTGSTGDDHMNGFFSFHRVFRENDIISSIKEIKCIYSKTGEKNYVYSYKDSKTGKIVDEDGNTFNADSSLTLLFDTVWLGHDKVWGGDLDSDGGRVYYFEIPVDGGEYCLGGFKTNNGRTADGAYLIYLDIGANAAQTRRTTVAEHFYEMAVTCSYPLGVALIPTNILKDEDTTFNANDSVCVVIKASYVGELIVSRDKENNVKVTREATFYNVAKPSYISDTIVSVVDPGLSGDDSDLMDKLAYDSKVETETYQIQYYDYNVNRDDLTITIIEDVRIKEDDAANWGNFARTISQQLINENGEGEIRTLNSEDDITNGNIVVFKYFGEENANNGNIWSYEDITNLSAQLYYFSADNPLSGGTPGSVSMATVCGNLSTLALEIYHVTEGEIDISDFQIVLEMIVDEEISDDVNKYYKVADYVIIPVAVNGSVVYVVKSVSSDLVFYFISSTEGEGTKVTGKDQNITVTIVSSGS